MDISFQIKEAKLLECGEAKRPLRDTSAWLAALASVSESVPGCSAALLAFVLPVPGSLAIRDYHFDVKFDDDT